MAEYITRIGFLAAAIIGLLIGGQARAQEQKTSFKFDFSKSRDNHIVVAPGDAFNPQRGYGFDQGTQPVAGDHCITSDRPFFFSVALPEGTYRITATLGDAKSPTATTIKAESHRLMVELVKTTPEKYETRTFLVNIRTPKMTPPVPTNAPGRNEVTLSQFEARNNGGLTWDDKLTLEFANSRPSLCALEIDKVDNAPTIFLAGDSTVTDQQGNTTTSWGQMLTRFLKPDAAVANYAESGETMKSFMAALRFDKMLGQMKTGDYLFIQFGHNDSKSQWPQTYAEANTTYKAWLKVYIAEAKRRGVTPVLISPMERRNGATGNTHGQYPDAVRQVAEEEKVAFIDLHAMSKTLYQALGTNVNAAFNDATHHSRYGAYELAKCIVAGIRQNKLDLAKSIVDDFGSFDPTKPDPADQFLVPQSPSNSASTRPIIGS